MLAGEGPGFVVFLVPGHRRLKQGCGLFWEMNDDTEPQSRSIVALLTETRYSRCRKHPVNRRSRRTKL